MRCLVCLLEEPSAAEMLKGVLPRLLPEDEFHYKCMVFEGKQDLEKRLESRIKYWQVPDSLFLVLRDQDSGDCYEIKKRLKDKVEKSTSEDKSLVRIACHELETFYLGDLDAVENALAISGLSSKQDKSKYKNPDALGNPAEEMYKLTNEKYQKVSGSRAIGPHLKLDGRNKSTSFNVLVKGIQEKVLGRPE